MLRKIAVAAAFTVAVTIGLVAGPTTPPAALAASQQGSALAVDQEPVRAARECGYREDRGTAYLTNCQDYARIGRWSYYIPALGTPFPIACVGAGQTISLGPAWNIKSAYLGEAC